MKANMRVRDIARRAGVSTTTVLRALHEQPDVDPEIRRRVLRVMEKHGFAASGAGPVCPRVRGELIGVLMPSLTWAMIPPMLSGIADVIEQTPCELALYDLANKRERVQRIQRIVAAKQVGGLIALYPDGLTSPTEVVDADRRVSQYLSRLHETGLPVVVIDDQTTHDDTPWISADNRQGAMDAIRHLIRLGHRRIAHISGPQPYLCARDRLEGYRAALEEARLPADRTLEVAGDFTAASGWAGAIYLLALPEPPTAIFAANDDMAGGVLTAVRQHGLRVPEDVAVVGCDDACSSSYTRPPLTAIRQPFFEMGWWAATRLLELLDLTAPIGPQRPSDTRGGRRPPTCASPALSAIEPSLSPSSGPSQRPCGHIQLPVQLTQGRSSSIPKGVSRISRSASPEAFAGAHR